MKTINTKNAVGCILFHDLTQIIKGVKKGPRFKKGHIIREEDVDVLLSMGKEHIYILDIDENSYHENDAAFHLAEICQGENTYKTDVSEGKIEIKSNVDGVLKVNIELLDQLNSIDNITIATKFNNTVVRKDASLCGTRVTPLVIDKKTIVDCEEIAKNKKIISVKPFIHQKVAIITTGSEVYYKRIEDNFTPVVKEKLKNFDFELVYHAYSTDDKDDIKNNIEEALKNGAEVIICTGGMSVDPDDNTPGAISLVSDNIITYGTPVLPGSMFMLAYKGDVVIMGLPGAVMYYDKTVFDFIIQRIAIKEKIVKSDIVKLGHGGMI